MKVMVKVVVAAGALVAALISAPAMALPWSKGSGSAGMDMGVLAGLRLNDASSRVSGVSVDGVMSLQLGGLAFLPMSDKFVFRTGFIYAQRNYEVKAGGNTTDAEFGHFDIPATFMYKISDMGGIFAGPGLGLKVKDDCDGSDCSGAKSMIIPIMFGGNFKIAPQVALEFYYETVTGKLSDGLKDASAVVANAVMTFE